MTWRRVALWGLCAGALACGRTGLPERPVIDPDGGDAGVAAADAAPPRDAGWDAGLDAGADGGLDAGGDAGPADAGGCGPGSYACGTACFPDGTVTCGPSCAVCTGPTGSAVACVNGACVARCLAGAHLCGGACVPESNAGCGPSCQPCPAGSGCVNEQCVASCAGTLGFRDLMPLLPTASPPTPFAIADVTGDGRADLLAFDVAHLYVAAQRAGGGLSAPLSVAPGLPSGIKAAAAGDFDGDGLLDVVVLDSNALFLARGTGTGLGAAAGVAAVAAGSDALSAVDVDHDGKLDLVAWATVYSSTPSWLRGNGDGSFQPPLPLFSNGASFNRFYFGDLNGDGAADLIGVYSSSGGGAYVNDGAGHFAISQAFYGTSVSYLLAGLGDVDGDGVLDLVGGTNGGRVVTWHGNGDGTFSPAVASANGFATPGLVSDLNGDGLADLVVYGGGYWSSYLSSGGGAMTSSQGGWLGPSSSTAGVIAGDLTGDGVPDIVGGDSMGLAMFVGKGGGAFAEPFAVSVPHGDGIAVADFDGDGHPDVMAYDEYAGATLLLGDGAGGLAPAWHYAPASRAFSFAVGDLDGDGRPDLALFEDPTVELLFNAGGGQFDAPFATSTGAVASIGSPHVVDFDGDGFADLVYEDGSQLEVMRGHGRTFDTERMLVPTAIDSPRLADLDGDGRLDLLALTGDGKGGIELATWLQSATGSLTNLGAYPQPVQVDDLAVVDLDGDGREDALVIRDDGLLTWRLGQGGGALGPEHTAPGLLRGGGLSTGDLDRDGRLDATLSDSSVVQVTLDVLGAQVRSLWLPPPGGGTAVPVDLNGDGWLDLVVPSQVGVTVMLGQCR